MTNCWLPAGWANLRSLVLAWSYWLTPKLTHVKENISVHSPKQDGKKFQEKKVNEDFCHSLQLLPNDGPSKWCTEPVAGLLTEGSGGMAEDGAAPQDSEGVPSLPDPHPCETLGYPRTLGAFPRPRRSGSLGSNLHSSVHLMWVAAGAASVPPTLMTQFGWKETHVFPSTLPLPPAASSLSLPLFCILDSRGSLTCITSSCFELK